MGQFIVTMAEIRLKIQSFRTNDLVDNAGKQFELGKSWCEDFFNITNDVKEKSINLVFKALDEKYQDLNGSTVELKLSDVNMRGDRKAYSNSEAGCSQIKDFFIHKLHLTIENNLKDYFAVYKNDEDNYNLYFVPELLYDNFINLFKVEAPMMSVARKSMPSQNFSSSLPLQQIIYGAPGTGKSHTIKEQTVGKEVIRTTFHPDSDYSTFVGTYKPTTKSIPVTTVIGTKAVAVEDEEGNKISEDKIVYEFVPQAFLQAYVSAWQKYANMKEGEQPEEEILVIEEINRGNCAQIFGDLFQLLDRGDSGFSEYPIKADADMKKFLQKAFANISLDGVKGVLAAVYDDTDIASQVLAGDVLLLPNNLYIWATMNTSDQSLFPIDSAFKRRWDWQYVPINNAGLNYVIEVNGNRYDWWHFLEEINQRIYKVTYSEDKKLGYFFCKARNGVIDTDTFVSKVVFYLWNDVFKDMEFEGDAFRDGENGKLTFDKFYTVEGNKTKVVSEKVEVFLKNLGLEALDNKE